MFDNRHGVTGDANSDNDQQAGKTGQADWKNVIGRHSVMLALEPRFMFDAAVGDTVAEVDHQQQEAAESAHGGDGESSGEPGVEADGGDGDVKDPLESFGIDPRLMARGGIGPQAAGPIEFDETGQVFDELDDQNKPLHWEVGKIVDIDKDPNEEITVTVTLDSGTLGKLTINENYYTYGDNTLVTVVGDVAKGDTTVTITGLAKNVLAVLEGLEFDAQKNWSGAGKITFDVDGESADLDFTVKPMNHLPELSVPTGDVKVFEDQWGNIANSLGGGQWDLAVTDVDAGDELTVKILADHDNAFRVGTSGSGMSGVFDSNSGKWVYTFTGSVDDINQTLGQLQYRGAPDDFGDDTITIMYQDREMGGKTDVSNPDGIWKSRDLLIRVTGVNDDPVFDPGISAGSGWLNGSVAEGGTISLTEDMFGLVDVEQTEGEIFITILEVPDHGVLQIYNGTSWVDLAVGSRFTYDQIKNTSGSNIRYVHGGGQVRDPSDGAPNQYHNLDGFKFNVNDGAGGFLRNDPADPSSGVREVEFTLNLTPINQGPVVTIEPSPNPDGDPANPADGYYTEVKPGVGTNPDGSPKYDISISVFEDEADAVIKFQITDTDQIGDFLVYITELPDALDGYLSYNGQKLTAADFVSFGDGKSGILISYADVLAGKLTFTHSGKDGWNGSGFQSPGLENDHLGMTRNTGFKIVVVDDGGGAGAAAKITTDPVDITITVKPNNDMPEYKDGLTEINGENRVNASTDPSMGDGKDGVVYVDGTGGNWIIQLGGKNNNGGFRVTDDDSRASEITYKIENDMDNGRIYIKTGPNQYKVLHKGDSFTQKQINDGDVYYIFSSAWGTEGTHYTRTETQPSRPEYDNGNPVFELNDDNSLKENRDEFDQLVWTDLRDANGDVVIGGDGQPVKTQYIQKWTYAQGYYEGDDKLVVTVRDGSYTAWVKGDNGTVHREGVEAGVGKWNGDAFEFTEVTIDFDLHVNFGGPGKPIETGTILEIGAAPGQVPTANEGKSIALAGDGYSIVDIYYADKSSHGKLDSESTDAIKCRVTDVPSSGKLVYRGPGADGQGTIEREINQFDEFFYKDLQYIFYEHDGSENFTDSFVISVSDGSLYLGDNEADSKLTINLNIAPANDTPVLTPGELIVDEGPESHQGGDDTFDRNGSILGPEHLGIADADQPFVITDGTSGTADMYLRDGGNNKVMGHDGSYYTNILKVGPDDKIVLGGDGKPVYFTETELREYHSSDSDITFVIYEKPAYGDIWVYTGSGDPLTNGLGVDLDDANTDLASDPDWHKLTDAEYASYLNSLNDIYNHDPADWGSLGAFIFTQADLAAGRVRYVHNGQDTRDNNGKGQNDQIKIIVNDGQGVRKGGEGANQQSVAEMVVIEVGVKDVNDAPELVKNDPVKTPENGNYKPGYTPSGGVGDPNYGTVITPGDLNFFDAEQNPNNLKYEVTKCTEQGTVYRYRESSGTWVALEKGSTFTQDDINKGYVKYVHNGTETHGIGDTVYDVLEWTLRDGDVNPDKWIDGQLKLEIMPSNNAPEIITDTGPANGKFREEDGYLYISDKNRVDQVNPADAGSDYYKDLGGLFQVKDRDYDDLSSTNDFKGIADDKMEVTLSSSFTKDGAPASYTGKFWYDDQALATPGVKIYVEASDGTRTEITGLADSEGKIIIVGTRDQINDFLDALIYYSEPDKAVSAGSTPGDNEADLNAVLNIDIKVDDLANGAAMTDAERADHNLTDTDSIKIWISTVNDEPTFNNSPDGTTLVTNEDTAIRITGPGGSVISISDPDTFDTTKNTVKITLGPGKGKFVDASGNAYSTTTDGFGNTVLEFTGSMKQINNILANLYYDPQGDWNGDANICIEYTDCVPGTPRPGMQPFTVVADLTVEVVPTNDAPVLDVPNGDQYQFIDGGATESDPSHWHNVGGGITVDDIDFNADVDSSTGYHGSNVLEVTLTPNKFENGVVGANQGKLRINGILVDQAWVQDTTLGVTMNPDGSLVLKGTKDQINAALADLQYFAGQIGNGSEDLNLGVKVSIHVDDLGNGHLSGQDPKSVDGHFFVMVGDKNDKPEIVGNGPWSVDEDGQLDFTGSNAISINDPDALDGYLTVTLKTVNGKLTLPDGTTLSGWNPGKEYVSIKANGTHGSLVTIYGTQAHINAILGGMKYTPKTDYNGTENMVVTSNDNGNTSASGGPKDDTRTIAITVRPINDAPAYQTGSDKQVTITATEDDKAVDATPGYTVNDLFTTTGSHTTNGKPALYQDNRDNSDSSSAQGFKGIVVVGDASTAAQGKWQYKTSGGTWTDLPSVSTADGLFLAADTQIRFIPEGDYNGPAGKLTVHMVDSSTVESAGFTNGSRHDLTGGEAAGKTGGTTAVSKDTAAINLNVGAVNDAPTINSGKDAVAWPGGDISNKANDAANTGGTIGGLFGPSFNDQIDNVTGGSNADSMLGVVVVGSTGEAGKGQWQYKSGSNWVDIPPQSPGSGFYLSNATEIRFNPDPDHSGPAPDLTVKLVDNSAARGTSSDPHYNPAKPTVNGAVDISVVGGDTRYSAGDVVLSIGTYEGDNSPVVEAGKATATESMSEDGAPAHGSAKTVDDIFSGSFNNGDKGLDKTTGFAGIVITECVPDSGKGSWEYWNGSGWTTINIASAANALYLDAGTEIRFNPKTDYNGLAPTLKAHLVEEKSGGGSPHANGAPITNFDPDTRYSNNHEAPYTSDAVTVVMTVNPVNDAPEFQTNSDKQVNITATEDDKAVDATSGYTVNDLFTQNGSHLNAGKSPLYQDARDDSGISSGQNFKGIVIVGDASTSSEGRWQYKTSGGAWTDLPAVSDADGLFLAADTQIRFIPEGDYNGPAGKLTVHMVDSSAESSAFTNNSRHDLTGTGKTGGTTAVSADTADINLAVTPVNDAPTVVVGKDTVNGGNLSNKVLDTNNNGNSVENLFKPSFKDAADTVAGGSSANDMMGVVVVGSTGEAGKGQWQYKVGSTWVDIPDQPSGKGFYLSNDTVVRFKPDANYTGMAPDLTVKLVDDSAARGLSSSEAHFNPAKPTGNGQVDLAVVGGDTRYSGDNVTLGLTITGGNNSPVPGGPNLELAIDEDSRPGKDDCKTVGDLFTGGSSPIFNNGEGSNVTDGFAGIVIVDCQPDAGKGSWEYWDTGANDWAVIDVEGGVDDPLFLSADTIVRFNPVQDFNGAAPGMEVHLVENDTGGNSPIAGNGPVVGFDKTAREPGHQPPYSQTTVQVEMTVRPINDAPTIGGIADIASGVDEQTPVIIAPGGVLDDVELGVSEKDDWGGAVLTIRRGDGAGSAVTPCPEDVFGAKAGGDMVFVPDGKVYLSGTAVGSYTNGGGVLTITFAPGVDTATANEVLQSITYTYDRDDVPGGDGVSGDIDLVYTIDDMNNGSATVEGGQGYGSKLTASWDQKITVGNTPDEATPVDDAGDIDLAVGNDTSGNVLVNDAHKDYPVTFTPGDTLEVVKVDGRDFPDVNGDGIPEALVVVGEYGTLVINPDGTYTYTVDPDNPKTRELVAAGGDVTETFVYEAQAKSNTDPTMRGSAELVISITAPVPPPAHISNPEQPVTDDPSVPTVPGLPPLGGNAIGDAGEVEKPINSTVNEAANNANNHIDNHLDGLNNQFNPRPLPPSLDSPGGLRDAAHALEEPSLVGNTDQKMAETEQRNEFTLAEDLFVHSNRQERLTYTATLPDGSPLPDWMEFDPETLCINCEPPADAVGTIEVIIHAEDKRGLQADATVNIKIGEGGAAAVVKGSDAEGKLEEEDELDPAVQAEEVADVELALDAETVEGDAGETGAAEGGSEVEAADEEEGEQSEAPAETTDTELIFAGEWLRLEAEAAKADAAAAMDAGAHPGLRTQIAATGSGGIGTQARVLLESLLSE